MDARLFPILKALMLVPVTLLPSINPLSTALIFAATVPSDGKLGARFGRQVAIAQTSEIPQDEIARRWTSGALALLAVALAFGAALVGFAQ